MMDGKAIFTNEFHCNNEVIDYNPIVKLHIFCKTSKGVKMMMMMMPLFATAAAAAPMNR